MGYFVSKRKTAEDRVIDSFAYIFLLLFSLSILYPFWSILMDSFSADSSTLGLKLLPADFSLEAYAQVFKQKTIAIAYLNTIFRAGLGTVLAVIITFCAAYPLSKRKMPFNKVMVGMVVFTMFFSGGLIPEYIVIQKLNLIDNRWVLILPYLVSGFYVLVMRNFMEALPSDLEESAFIDGANELVIAIKIIFPLTKPIIATVALWAGVFYWNEWFQAMIYIRSSDKQVMQVLLRRLILESQISAAIEEVTGAIMQSEESIKAATLFIAIGPILAVYPFAQKYFIKGIMTGAIKG